MKKISRQKDRIWRPQAAAERALARLLDAAHAANPAATAFASRLLKDTAIRTRDIVDHLTLPGSECEPFLSVGWARTGEGVLRNVEGNFPPIVPSADAVVWLRVESVAQFLAANDVRAEIEGTEYGPMRRARVFRGQEWQFGVIERNGYAGFEVPNVAPATIREARLVLQAFRSRRREFDAVEQGIAHTQALVDQAVDAIGAHWACAAWLTAERDFWMRRCKSGALAKARQDAAGVGWANIDHHTYDGSREHFRQTIGILEKLGYELREMLYAGELAGWGSQVLEQPVIGSTIFADVDLAPEELNIDFAHEALPALPRHRRAGLLSALLGESILEAGLNHVAGLYDQQRFRAQLLQAGFATMAPFTDFPHLYQELTTGDWVAVDPGRVDALERAGHIGADEAERLRTAGSILSHLENIERNDGFKGFNREGIDSVLRKLDPRAYAAN